MSYKIFKENLGIMRPEIKIAWAIIIIFGIIGIYLSIG